MKKEEAIETAAWIDEFHAVITPVLFTCPVEKIEETLKHLRDKLSKEQVLGVMIDPSGSEQRELGAKFRIDRLNAILNIVKVYQDTEVTIHKIKKLDTQKTNLIEELGL